MNWNTAGAWTGGTLNDFADQVFADGHPEARYIWTDASGCGRNLHACFRLTFTLDAPVVAAKLCLFADSAYQLFVNGRFVEFGPVRFDPRFPMYDPVDLAPFLRTGRNAIAVAVNSFQHKTYKTISHPAGFIAWGGVQTAAGSVSLQTPGSWRCIPDAAQARYVGKFSFALNAAELYDQAGEQPGWREAEFDDQHWPVAVPVAAGSKSACSWTGCAIPASSST